ncbi:MAG: Methyltransferase type 11 [Dehalococcoidia bacterium]|nr:Methyltransferase type 11 [Dehalococcoidia bacterium]
MTVEQPDNVELGAIERIAPFYDQDYGDYDQDLEFYLNYAKRTGSPILELGVGTGRVAIPLALAGHQVVGVDASVGMLELCRKKLRGGLSERLKLVQGDFRNLDLGLRFNMVFSAANTFGHITTQRDQASVLESVRRHLEPRGLLILDLDNPESLFLNEGSGGLLLDWVRPALDSKGYVMKLVSAWKEPETQLKHITFIYDEVGEDSVVRRTMASFRLRYSYQSEMELLLDCSGYRVEAVYGSYDLDAYAAHSERMIFVARPQG